jgi:hypothetical protein
MDTTFEKGTRFIWETARLLDRAIYAYFFQNGSPDWIKSILRTYQNDDGGFAHAIEPDLRAPGSQPVSVEFALRTLYECNMRDQDIAYRACDFLAQNADLQRGIAMNFPSSMDYPHAPHMDNLASQQPGLDRLIGLVGLVNWHGVQHPWLKEAVETCLEHIVSFPFDDAHTIRTAFCFVESLEQNKPADRIFEKLSHDLMKANFFCLDTPVSTYGLTPLSFAPSPTSYCRRIFTQAQIDAHLEDLLAHQQPDGGWPILWEPPSEMSRLEWRAHTTVQALATLRAYGKV